MNEISQILISIRIITTTGTHSEILISVHFGGTEVCAFVFLLDILDLETMCVPVSAVLVSISVKTVYSVSAAQGRGQERGAPSLALRAQRQTCHNR